MTDPITTTRFAELADAYGGTVARWPEDVRTTAMAIAAQPEVQAILAEAGRLDARLDLWCMTAPSPVLGDRIVASYRELFSPKSTSGRGASALRRRWPPSP